MSACECCPIPELCIRKYPVWCEWARDKPRDSIEVRSIVDASRMAAGLPALRGEPIKQPEYPAEYPPVATQAGSLALAFWGWATSGFKMASEAEQARRRAICAACPNWAAEARRCVLCGCLTDVKIAMRSEKCPDDPPRW